MPLKILYIAEIVGKTGVFCIKSLLPQLRQTYQFDLLIANADGATNAAGLGKNHAGYLHKLGIQILTCGDTVFYKKDLVNDIDTISYVLRPHNFPKESPGRGYKFITVGTQKIAVLSLLGASRFTKVHANNPFESLTEALEFLKKETNHIIVDFHAATTAEKRSFSIFADGKVSAVIGSHGRVQTADERILKNGTASITDAGMTGALGVGGVNAQQRIIEYVSGIPNWIREIAPEQASQTQLQGVYLTIKENGYASSIERIHIPLKGSTHA